MADKQQQASGSAASRQYLASLLAAAAATAAAGAAAAWYWRSSQRLPATAQRSGSAPAKALGIETGAAAAPQGRHDSDVDGTLTPPLRADLAAKMATISTSWVQFPSVRHGHRVTGHGRTPSLPCTHRPCAAPASCTSHRQRAAALSAVHRVLQGDSSWYAAGALPGDVRAISAQAALQTDDANGGGWGACSCSRF